MKIKGLSKVSKLLIGGVQNDIYMYWVQGKV